MEKISKLIKLWLHNNKISRIENLSSLRLLEELDLDDNQIVVV
jgi:Leucine-rich repeat (LRR) protein